MSDHVCINLERIAALEKENRELRNDHTDTRESVIEMKSDMKYIKTINNKIYLPQLNKTYLQVMLKHNGKGYQVALGRVACAAFVYNDNPELKKMVDHINGNRIDDRIENLQWQSQSNNLKKKKMGKGYFEQRVKY